MTEDRELAALAASRPLCAGDDEARGCADDALAGGGVACAGGGGEGEARAGESGAWVGEGARAGEADVRARLAERLRRLAVEAEGLRLAEHRRRASEQARLQAEGARQAEERARHASMREAVVAQARTEAALRAELAVSVAEQEHQRRLLQLRLEVALRNLRLAITGAAGAVLLVASAGFALYFGVVAPAHAEELQAARESLIAARAARGTLERSLDRARTELLAEQAENAMLRRQRDATQRHLNRDGISEPAPLQALPAAPRVARTSRPAP
ncbi:MAG: hypothetical protein KIT72_19930 [Polyangiaceae bacterium]|nr:hypothetical protein [Polyangiaceae bacterium]MCW5792692.1 hypothetical protein [Polyangiaceae bacterium]